MLLHTGNVKRQKFDNRFMEKITKVLFVLLLVSCSVPDEYIVELPDKVVTTEWSIPRISTVYSLGETFKINISTDPGKYQSLCGWVNNEDYLLMSESSMNSRGQYFYQNLYLIDFEKNIVDTLYLTDVEEIFIMDLVYVTPNDSLLLILVKPHCHDIDTSEYSSSPYDIILIDFNTKMVNERIENFCTLSLYYRPSLSYIFSPSGRQFVYALSDERYIKTERVRGNEVAPMESNGIYIYDLEKRTHNKIAIHGVDPIWSPDGTTIAYFSAGTIWFYDINSEEESVFYKSNEDHTIVDIQWTPDGDNVYCRTRHKKYWFSLSYTFDAMLINIQSKKESRSDELSKLGYYFYWK